VQCVKWTLDDEGDAVSSENDATLWCVGRVKDTGEVVLIDFGYRSLDEAKEAWPQIGE
jgi:hypothetical protein